MRVKPDEEENTERKWETGKNTEEARNREVPRNFTTTHAHTRKDAHTCVSTSDVTIGFAYLISCQIIIFN